MQRRHACVARAALRQPRLELHKNYAALFNAWKTEHGKEYLSAFAEAKAFKAFAHNEEVRAPRHRARSPRAPPRPPNFILA